MKARTVHYIGARISLKTACGLWAVPIDNPRAEHVTRQPGDVTCRRCQTSDQLAWARGQMRFRLEPLRAVDVNADPD